MDEQDAGSAQVLQSISEIQTSSEIVKENTGILLSGGKQIGEEMAHLANVTREINDAMNEMAAGSGQITKAVELCFDLTNDNQKCVVGFTASFDVDKDKPRIEVELETVE